MNAKVVELCELHEAPEALTKALNELTAPKPGGSSDVNDYTCFDEDEKPVSILCNVFKLWFPVEEFKEGKAANGFSRYSNAGREDYKARAKAYKNGKNAVIADLLEGKLTNDEAKEELANLEVARQTVGGAPENGLAEKPCGETEEA